MRIPLGAVELVCQHSLLTVLSAVSSADSQDLPSSKSSHLLLLSSVVKVLNALWKTMFITTTRKDIIASDTPDKLPLEPDDSTVFESTARKDIIASDIPDKQLLEPDENHGKRKTSTETTINPPKRLKLELKNDASPEDFDSDVDERDEKLKDSNVPVQKLLPPLFVHEYLNTVQLLLPAVIANCPPITLATYLQLVSEVVHFVETIIEFSSKKQKIRLAALAPDAMKEQVS